MRYPCSRSAFTCFQTAARERPSLSLMVSPETNSSGASARKARTCSSLPVTASGMAGFWAARGGVSTRRVDLEGDVGGAGAVGERPHRDVVHPGGGHPGEPLQGHVAARLEKH